MVPAWEGGVGVRGVSEQLGCHRCRSPVFTENIYIMAAHDKGGQRRNCKTRRMFTRHWGGGRGGMGRELFVCEYLYTVKELKRNGDLVCQTYVCCSCLIY